MRGPGGSWTARRRDLLLGQRRHLQGVRGGRHAGTRRRTGGGQGERLLLPHVLPGGKAILFTSVSSAISGTTPRSSCSRSTPARRRRAAARPDRRRRRRALRRLRAPRLHEDRDADGRAVRRRRAAGDWRARGADRERDAGRERAELRRRDRRRTVRGIDSGTLALCARRHRPDSRVVAGVGRSRRCRDAAGDRATRSAVPAASLSGWPEDRGQHQARRVPRHRRLGARRGPRRADARDARHGEPRGRVVTRQQARRLRVECRRRRQQAVRGQRGRQWATRAPFGYPGQSDGVDMGGDQRRPRVHEPPA